MITVSINGGVLTTRYFLPDHKSIVSASCKLEVNTQGMDIRHPIIELEHTSLLFSGFDSPTMLLLSIS
jgi:hypothetical protein